MSWFLGSIRSKKKVRASKAKPAKAAGVPWDRQKMTHMLRWLASGLVVAAIVLGWHFGRPALVGYASSHHSVMITGEHVTLVDAPPWMHDDIQRDLRWLVAGQLATDPMNAASLQKAVDTLAANPWIEGVARIERTSLGIAVHARYREPVALVMAPRRRETQADYLQKTDALHLVDARGVRLPSDSLGVRDVPYRPEHAKALDLPVIVGIASPSPKPGQVWASAELQAGLKLAALLRNEPYAHQIAAFDVSGRDKFNRIRLALHTRAGGTVWWGLPPGEKQSSEPDAVIKRRWLSFLNGPRNEKGFNAIDAGGRVVLLLGSGPEILTRDEEATRLAELSSSTASIQRARLSP
ncbi:MAG: hypothetical protein WD768_00200 [Phycisphaeraceae bacterium]